MRGQPSPISPNRGSVTAKSGDRDWPSLCSELAACSLVAGVSTMSMDIDDWCNLSLDMMCANVEQGQGQTGSDANHPATTGPSLAPGSAGRSPAPKAVTPAAVTPPVTTAEQVPQRERPKVVRTRRVTARGEASSIRRAGPEPVARLTANPAGDVARVKGRLIVFCNSMLCPT